MVVPLAKQNITEEMKSKLLQVLDSGWWTTGKVTEELENVFANYLGVKYAIAVNSCSSALFLTLKLLGCTEDSEIYTTPLTFVSTINAGLHLGANIKFVDVEMETQCIDLGLLDQYFYYSSFDSIFVVPVHFAGMSCDINFLEEIKTNYYGMAVIGDCAHAVETEWNRKKVGNYLDANCYSFNPTKNVAAPEMGMITTNHDSLAQQLKLYRLHCMSSDAYDRMNKPGDYDVVGLGYKFNPTDIESAIALESIKNIDTNWEKRQHIWWNYNDCFRYFSRKGVFNGTHPQQIVHSNYFKHGLHLYQILIGNRDKFILEMRKKGVHCGIHYKPIHLHTYYKDKLGYKKGQFPNAEHIGEHTCSLPLGPGMTESDVDKVITTMDSILKEGDYLL